MRTLVALIVVIVAALSVFLVAGRRIDRAGTNAQERSSHDNVTAPPTDLEALTSSAHATHTRSAIANPAASSITSPSGTTSPDQPMCRVLGRVLDDLGAPIEGADVSMSDGFDAHARTAADGTFAIQTPLAKYGHLTADSSDSFGTCAFNFSDAFGSKHPFLVPGDNDVGDLVLARCGSVKVHVVSDRGEPIESTSLTIFGGGNESRREAPLDGQPGDYVLARVDVGHHRLRVDCAGWMSSPELEADVTFGAATTLPDVVLSLAPELSGTVVDETGEPVSGISLVAIDRNPGSDEGNSLVGAKSEFDGSFTFDLPRAVPYRVEVSYAPAFEPWPAPGDGEAPTYAAGTQNIRIVLQSLPLTTFRVIDATTREPIFRFGIVVRLKDTWPFYASDDLGSPWHRDGEAQLPASPLTHSVLVIAPEHAPVEARVVFDAGAPRVQTIALERASVLQGRLVFDHAPLAHAVITLEGEIAPEVESGFAAVLTPPPPPSDLGRYAVRQQTFETKSDGTFRFDSLAAGTFHLTIEARGGANYTLDALSIPTGATKDLGDIEIAREAIVRGHVLTSPQESPIGFFIRLDEEQQVVNSADGSFEFKSLRPGPHTITWERPIGSSLPVESEREQRFQLAAGETREIMLDARSTTPCTVRVRVTRNGRPARGVYVAAWFDDGLPNFMPYTPLEELTDDGVAKGTIDAGRKVVLVVLSAGRILGRGRSSVLAVPGGTIEDTIELRTGTLRVELPSEFSNPKEGVLCVEITGVGGVRSTINACPPAPDGSLGLVPCELEWKGRTLACGELEAGAFDARVTITRLEPNPEQPQMIRTVDMHAPYETKVVIEAGREAKIVVP